MRDRRPNRPARILNLHISLISSFPHLGINLIGHQHAREAAGVFVATGDLLRMEILHGRSRLDCYEPGVTAINEINLNPMNSQP